MVQDESTFHWDSQVGTFGISLQGYLCSEKLKPWGFLYPKIWIWCERGQGASGHWEACLWKVTTAHWGHNKWLQSKKKNLCTTDFSIIFAQVYFQVHVQSFWSVFGGYLWIPEYSACPVTPAALPSFATSFSRFNFLSCQKIAFLEKWK